MKNYLCIDYGQKHVGLAIATTPIAEPVTTVNTNDVIETITKLVQEYNIKTIVIGISENQMAQETRQFSVQLKAMVNLPVIFHDETLSSFETRQKIAKAKMKKSKREAKVDHLVATAILQDYLDSSSSNS